MRTKNWLLILASCVALAALPAMGCGDDDDPSDANNGSTENNNAGNNNTDNNNAGNNNTDNNNTGNNNTDNNNTGNNNTGNNNTGNNNTGNNNTGNNNTGNNNTGNNNTGNNNTDPSTCVANDWWNGQVHSTSNNPETNSGGKAVENLTTPLADAGLAEANDAIPELETDDEGNDVETKTVFEEPLQITGALVTATINDSANSSAFNNFWVQDANVAMMAYRAFDNDPDIGKQLQVGDVVSFKITEVSNYFGKPEITGITDFELVTPTSEDSEVPVTDLTGQDIDVQEYFNKVIRVSGEISEEQGGCGGNSLCYTLSHGDKEDTLRVNQAMQLGEGDCVTFVGPLSAFPNILEDNPGPQLEAVNFSWLHNPGD